MAAQPSQEEGVKIVVTGLNIFPIKSCKACKVNKIGFDSHGVVGDRRFMLIDGKNRFITQRKYPTLAMVEAVWVDCKDTGKKILKINAPRMKELVVVPIIDGPRIETTIWEDTVMTVDQGQEACEWFSSYLEIGSNIIRLAGMAEQAPGYTRTVSHLPPGLQGRLPPTPVVLTDRGPASIISNESLADLNLRLKERTGDHTVPLNRFRMNIEVTGCAHPFEEDEWLVIRIATTVLLVYVANEVSMIGY